MRVLLVTVGVLCVGCGTAGVFLPLVPTTPFVLLAAACFARSSPRLHGWLVEHRLFGEIIVRVRDGAGLPRRTLVAALALLWGTLAASICLAVPAAALGVRLGLVGIGLAVTLYLLWIARPRQTSGERGGVGAEGYPRVAEDGR